MGAYENEIRAAIRAKFGSVSKMAEALDVPKTTIYHALDRGIDNTTVKTRNMILDALKPEYDTLPNAKEIELIKTFRTLSASNQETLIKIAKALGEK